MSAVPATAGWSPLWLSCCDLNWERRLGHFETATTKQTLPDNWPETRLTGPSVRIAGVHCLEASLAIWSPYQRIEQGLLAHDFFAKLIFH